MVPAISQISSLQSSMARDLEDYAAAHCGAVELYFTKVETYVQSHSSAHLRGLLDEHGIQAAVAGFQGGLFERVQELRDQAWQQLRERLDLCQQLGVETVVVACDVRGELTQANLDRLRASLVQLAHEAGERGVRVALEFQARSAFGNNLHTAVALVSQVNSPHLGICLDTFHFYVGPSKLSDLELLTRGNLFHVQVSDVADVPRELATDADRILPGDGDVPLQKVIDRLREIRYTGYVALELMNPQLWQVPPLQLGEIGMTALRRLLGQASMLG